MEDEAIINDNDHYWTNTNPPFLKQNQTNAYNKSSCEKMKIFTKSLLEELSYLLELRKNTMRTLCEMLSLKHLSNCMISACVILYLGFFVIQVIHTCEYIFDLSNSIAGS